MPQIELSRWGDSPAGVARLYTLFNDQGNYVRISNWGGVVQSIKLQYQQDKWLDVVLGYDRLDAYIENPVGMGAIIGRYANRIGQACFELDGQTYPLVANHGNHH